MDFALTEPDVFRGALLSVRPTAAPTPTTEPPTALPFYRLLLSAIVEGQTANLVRADDPNTMTQVLWAGIHGSLALPVNVDRYELLDQHKLAAAMTDQLIDHLLA